jgi:beta-fructofuranosidase
VLFVSPYGKVQYFVGDFDAAAGRFEAKKRGQLDVGQDFYAPNTMLMPDGRRLVWGWVRGFPSGRGWKGCLSLPRQLSVSSEGVLVQEPAPELAQLRGEGVRWRNLPLDTSGEIFRLPGTNTLEVRADIDLRLARGVELRFQSEAGGDESIVVRFADSKLHVQDIPAPVGSGSKVARLEFSLFVDRSVLEVFVNGTRAVTKVISPLQTPTTLRILAVDGKASVNRLEVWPMQSIW